MRFTLEMLAEQAKSRPPGYVDDVMAHATQPFAGVFELSNADCRKLREKYRPKTYGLGDAVATMAKPIARVLGLAECKGCKGRQALLNRAIPDLLHPFKH